MTGAADAFWTKTKGLDYAKPRPWNAEVAAAIAKWEPASVVELGCAAGRNLRAVRERLPEVRLLGIDIAPDAVRWGRLEWGLDLRLGGVEALEELPRGGHDVAFTVSCVNHVQEPRKAIAALLASARSRLLLLEPEVPGYVGVIDARHGVEPVPFTWAWDYPEMLAEAAAAMGKNIRVERFPHPLKGTRTGSLYARYEVEIL